MTQSPDRLYALLPAVYRLRDAEQGYPLKALMAVIAEQVNVVEDDITQLYDNWFIETSQDWVVPYIGDLIGYRPIYDLGQNQGGSTPIDLERLRIMVPRREVANTLHYRRRKGTLSLLEQLANDVAGWPARAVEFYRLLGWTQELNYQHPKRGRTADLRKMQPLKQLGTPFDTLAHTVDVRRPDSGRGQGRFNIPSAGVFAFRLKTYPVTYSPAMGLQNLPHDFTFSILGNNSPLYNLPQPEPSPTHIADLLNLPTPIERREFENPVLADGKEHIQASDAYYGEGKSLVVWAPDWPKKGAPQPIPRQAVIPADLSGWQYFPPRNYVAVDPELGRIAFNPGQVPRHGVYVSYHYAFSTEMGSGEYERSLSQPNGAKLYRVCKTHPEARTFDTLGRALDAWTAERASYPLAVIEICDSAAYTESLTINLLKNEYLQIRAADTTRPTLRPSDYSENILISGAQGSRLLLEGLLIAGQNIQVYGPDPEDAEARAQGDLCEIAIHHCTLVPGWLLTHECEPKRPADPSLELINTRVRIEIEHSILGSIYVVTDEVANEPVQVSLSDSILDATGSECEGPECEALGTLGPVLAHATLTIRRCTVFGRVYTHAIELAEDSIFMGQVKVGKRQVGCMRFCYVPASSRTPRRYHCQPDLVVNVPELSTQDKKAEEMRVHPQFNSTRYGTPDYCQLASAPAGAVEIRQGADDESEMGAFHNLFNPQREANLRTRLDEFTPAGMDCGLFFAS